MSDHQGEAILHSLGEGNKGIISRDDRRSSKRSTPSPRCICRSDFLLRSGDLSRNRDRLTNPLGLSTPLGRNRLGWRNWSLGRTPLCSSRSRSHDLDHDIYPIKEALHKHAHSSRNFPTYGVINRKGLGINLKKEEKERRQLLRQGEGVNKHAK